LTSLINTEWFGGTVWVKNKAYIFSDWKWKWKNRFIIKGIVAIVGLMKNAVCIFFKHLTSGPWVEGRNRGGEMFIFWMGFRRSEEKAGLMMYLTHSIYSLWFDCSVFIKSSLIFYNVECMSYIYSEATILTIDDWCLEVWRFDL